MPAVAAKKLKRKGIARATAPSASGRRLDHLGAPTANAADDDEDDLFALALAPAARDRFVLPEEPEEPTTGPAASEPTAADLLAEVLEAGRESALTRKPPSAHLHPVDARRQQTKTLTAIKKQRLAKKNRLLSEGDADEVHEYNNQLWNRRHIEPAPKLPRRAA